MKKLVIGLVAAIVLLVAVDYAAAATAEYQVSSRLRQQLALPDDPAVKISGFPFLTQALGGDYRRVDVSADRLTVGQMNNVGVRAQLYHVRLPLGEVLSGKLRSIHIDDLQGTVQVTDEDLRRQLRGVTKLKVQPVDPGALDAALANSKDAMPGSSVTGITPDQAVRLVATTEVLGQKTEVSVIAVLQLAGRQIQISPRDIRLGSGPAATRLPDTVQASLRRMFTLQIDPGELPFDVTPTTLRAVDTAIQVSGVAHNVTVAAASSGNP